MSAYGLHGEPQKEVNMRNMFQLYSCVDSILTAGIADKLFLCMFGRVFVCVCAYGAKWFAAISVCLAPYTVGRFLTCDRFFVCIFFRNIAMFRKFNRVAS